MFLLKKAFDLRDKANPESSDKPFLEHLEELRIVITRIVITLVVATLACFGLKDNLMELLRKPIEVVWDKSQQAKLPTEITPETWEQAKRASVLTNGLSEEERRVYFEQFENEKLAFYTQCAAYYRAARSLKSHHKQMAFIDSLPEISPKEKELTKNLLRDKENQPSEKVGARDNAIFMSSLRPTGTFMLSIKLAFFAGIIVSFPFILFFTLQFVLPGLKPEEKKALWPAMAAGFGLFLSGVLFCYFWVLPEALEFFYGYSSSLGVSNEWRIGDYISFATQFTLIFGLAFELPVVVMTLVKLGLLNYDIMSRTRSYAIVSILVIGAIITPTGDILTLSMLAGPMCLLYEICIWLAYFSRKKELEQEAEEMEQYRKLRASSTISAGAAATHDEDEDLTETEHDDDDGKACDEEIDEEGNALNEGEEYDDGVLDDEDLDDESEEEVSMLDTLRAPYDPYGDYNYHSDAEEKEADEETEIEEDCDSEEKHQDSSPSSDTDKAPKDDSEK